MTPKERLDEILKPGVLYLLTEKKFRYVDSKKHFWKKDLKIKHYIRFVGNRWNYADAVADFSMDTYSETPDYPQWLDKNLGDISNYQSGQIVGTHIPQLRLKYKENWDDSCQEAGRYDLLKYNKNEILNSIVSNLNNCILPHLDNLSDYSKIADNLAIPFQSFDFYMMAGEKEKANKKLLEFKVGLEEHQEKLITDEFYRHWAKMVNLRIKKLNLDIELIEIPNKSS